jgi:hypothetical protein
MRAITRTFAVAIAGVTSMSPVPHVSLTSHVMLRYRNVPTVHDTRHPEFLLGMRRASGHISRPVARVTSHVQSLVSSATMAVWRRVGWCETHLDWSFQAGLTFASAHTGALGIENSSWWGNGGTKFAPRAGLATPQQQVYIASVIQNGYAPPDQNGCTGNW